jgi:hypothetical protein
VGLDYVSCSPYRVPIARLAAARASLKRQSQEKKAKSLQEQPLSEKTAAVGVAG